MSLQSLGAEDLSVQFIRAFFNEDTHSSQKFAEKFLKDKGEYQALRSLVGDFRPKDIWGNRAYVFGYGLTSDGSTLLFAWKNSSDSPDIGLKELSGIYEDERMSDIETASDMKKWKKMREIVAGAFINLRKSEAKIQSIYPYEASLRASRIHDLVLTDSPLVIKFVKTPEVRVAEVNSEVPRR